MVVELNGLPRIQRQQSWTLCVGKKPQSLLNDPPIFSGEFHHIGDCRNGGKIAVLFHCNGVVAALHSDDKL